MVVDQEVADDGDEVVDPPDLTFECTLLADPDENHQQSQIRIDQELGLPE